MTVHWKELLPIDRYQVRANGILHEYYRKTMTSLYQPLIGAIAYSLYMTFWSQINSDNNWTESATHQSLMNMTQLDLNKILHARKKLEGIGLLTTFMKEEEDVRHFFYQLEAPLSPEKFFKDGALNIYLYNKLGNYQFQQMKKKFITSLPPASGLKQVTASFNDVFQSLHPSELMTQNFSEIDQAMKLGEGEEYVGDRENAGLQFTYDFDIEWLELSLSKFIVPKHTITNELKEAIKKLAYIYHIQPLQMKQIIETIFVKRDEINLDVLRKAVHDWYVFQNDHKLPQLSVRRQPPSYRESGTEKPESEEEKAVQLFETISPYELLERMAGGAKPASTDLNLVESIMFDQKLAPGVINVLLEYVMRTNDMKLTKAYVEKIAAHWARKRVKTVREAMALAKAEHQKYQTWSTPGKQKKSTHARKNVRKDKLPKWMTETIQDNTKNETEFEQKKKQLEERLKKYRQTTDEKI